MAFVVPALPAPAAHAAAPKAAAAPAAFEGVISMRLQLESGGGDMALSLAGGASRLDMKVTVSPLPEPVVLAILHKTARPRTVTLVDDRRKTWSEADLADAGRLAEGRGEYAVKVLGKGEHLGYACEHVTLTRDKEFVDAWISADLKDAFGVLRTLQEANPQVGEAGIFSALESAGHAGLPMRLTVIREGQRVTTEVVKVERKALPASLFAIPKGYRRQEGASAGP